MTFCITKLYLSFISAYDQCSTHLCNLSAQNRLSKEKNEMRG